MKKIIAIWLSAVLTTGGCSGGDSNSPGGQSGGTPPPPPPPPPTVSAGGLWVGELELEVNGQHGTHTSLPLRALVTEDGDFRFILDEQAQQIVGDFYVEGTDLKSNGGLFWYEQPWWITASADFQGSFVLSNGTVDERVSLTGNFQSTWPDLLEYVGSFSLAYDPLYERASSLRQLAGTYTGAGESLSIDDAGTLFYQSSLSRCVGNGSADLIDTDFNLYSVSVSIESCSGNDAARNGRTYTGFAYLADSGMGTGNDILELSMSLPISDNPTRHTGVTEHYIWNLRVHK